MPEPEPDRGTPSQPPPTSAARPGAGRTIDLPPPAAHATPPRPSADPPTPGLMSSDSEISEATRGRAGDPLPHGLYVPGYEIIQELGRGGMGVVYLARQVALGRLVALKMILAGSCASSRDRERFVAEAHAVARLQHPHVVQIFEVGEYEGHPYFSLEFCPGGSLSRRLNGTPQAPAEAARLARTLALAVEAAHLQRIVHRDLKPANVLLTEAVEPKVTDFGLAKLLDAGEQTRTGEILGTPSYMAPEQAAGKGKEVGPEADVWALGAILYELLTGRPPFVGETKLHTLQQVLTDSPVPPRRLQPRIPPDLETICLKCLEKEPHRRYASAAELADDLGRFLAGEPTRARPTPGWERAWRWARRRPAAAGLVAASLLALLGVGAALTGAVYNRWLEQALDREEVQRRRAEAALGLAERFEYFNRIALASTAWHQGNAQRVRVLLDQCPAGLRQWEWNYLNRLCQSDLATLRGPRARSGRPCSARTASPWRPPAPKARSAFGTRRAVRRRAP